MKCFLSALVLLLGSTVAAMPQQGEVDRGEQKLAASGWRPEIFKTTGEIELKVWYKEPAEHDVSGKTPAIVFFYGGGWRNRNIAHFHAQGEHLVERGMVVVLADYRAEKRYGGTPFDCVEDAKSAMRYVRAHADRLGIDPDRIAAGGGSAGGHLAAAAALVPGFNAASDDLTVSCIPNALVLFTPVYDNSPNGYGFDRLQERWEEISPLHHIKEGAPPNIVFLGDRDQYLSVATARIWKQKMAAAGACSELHIYEDRGHGFFNYGQDRTDTLMKTDAFLVELGYLEEK